MAPAIPAVVVLAIFLFSFAVVYTLRAFIGAMFQTLIDDLKAIPVIGGKLASPIEGIAQSVSNALGAAEGRIDQAIGASFHALARLTEWLWREFKAHAGLIASIATLTAILATAYHALKSLVHHIEHTSDAALSRVQEEEKRLQRGIDRINSKIKSLDHRISDVVMPRVKAAEGEIGHLEDVVIPDIRGIALGVGADLNALRKWITDNVPLIGTIGLTGAVAWALSELGLGWLRCSSNPFNNNKNACGLWGDLAGLLGLVTAVLVAEDFEALVREMQAVEGEAIGLAKDLFNVG